MLRRMENVWAAADLSALARRAAEWTALAGVTALLCRAWPVPGTAPFAMAFLAAALTAGWGAAALVAGCLLGALGGEPPRFEAAIPLGAAVALGGAAARDLLPTLLERARRALWSMAEALRGAGVRTRAAQRPAPARQARSPDRETAFCAALAGLSTLLPGLVRAGGSPWPSLRALIAALAALASAPFLRAALDALSQRPLRLALPEARFGLSLLACMLAAGLAAFSMPAALCLCCAAAATARARGALAGACLGAPLLLMGGDPRLAALTAISGAASQLCAGLSRRAREAACFAALVSAALALNLPLREAAAAGLAAPLAMAVPGRALRALRRALAPDPVDDPRRASARRLKAMAAAFGDLADGFRPPEPPPDERTLVAGLRAALCGGCPGFGECWSGGEGSAARLLCDLIGEAAAWSCGDMSAPLFPEESTPALARRCRRGRQIPARLGSALETFARERRSGRRRGADRALAAAQFARARRLLEELAARQMAPEPPRPLRLRAETGAVCASREAGTPSGDSHLVLRLDDGRLLALICDGMGSGEAAARESALAARLLGRLLAAGAGLELAVDTANAVLLERGGEDMFATVDLLLADLRTGEAELVKLAASPALLVRDGAARWIGGGRLPLGILEGVRPAVARLRLRPGDVLLMASDGVMDAADPAALESILRRNAPAADLARRALDAAAGAAHADDRTALCLRFAARARPPA